MESTIFATKKVPVQHIYGFVREQTHFLLALSRKSLFKCCNITVTTKSVYITSLVFTKNIFLQWTPFLRISILVKGD